MHPSCHINQYGAILTSMDYKQKLEAMMNKEVGQEYATVLVNLFSSLPWMQMISGTLMSCVSLKNLAHLKNTK